MTHTLINCTCKNRPGVSLLPFTLIPQHLKRLNWSKTRWNKRNLKTNREIHSHFACSRWPLGFPNLSRPYSACVRRGSGKRMFGLSLLRSSRQSNIPTSGEEGFKYPLPLENKISQMPYPRANKDNQILTSYSAPPGHFYSYRCISCFISLTIALLYIIGNYYFCMLIFKVVNEIHNFFDWEKHEKRQWFIMHTCFGRLYTY